MSSIRHILPNMCKCLFSLHTSVFLCLEIFQLTEVLNVTLKNGTNVKMTKSNGDELVTINPQYDDLSGKIAEHDVTDLQIRLKIFINNDDREGIADALDRGTDCVYQPNAVRTAMLTN